MIHHADVLDALRAMPDNSFHGSLTDPPYGLSFMGHQWDHGVPSAEVWREVLRVLRPGRPHQMAGASGDTLSLIPISGPAAGITTSGLDYPMQHGTLPFGATLGVSNVLTSATASVTLESGLLLAIHISHVQ